MYAKETFDEDGWRRMIYAHKVRMISVDVFGAFDCPDAGQMKPSRTRSITPVQSLGLFNSPFVNRQASVLCRAIARRGRQTIRPPKWIARSSSLTHAARRRPSELG